MNFTLLSRQRVEQLLVCGSCCRHGFFRPDESKKDIATGAFRYPGHHAVVYCGPWPSRTWPPVAV